MKLQEFHVNSGDCGGIQELGQYDLLYTYGAIVKHGTSYGASMCRVHP